MNVKKINYNEEQFDGCETCDYGSQYINNLEIIFDDDTKTNIVIDNMYEYAFTEADLMELLYANNTIEDFILSAIKKFVKAYCNRFTSITTSEYEIGHHLSYLDITYNDKNVDAKATYFYNSLKFKGDPEVAWYTFVKNSEGASPAAIREYADDYARVIAEYGSPEYEEAFKKAINYYVVKSTKLFQPKAFIINEANYCCDNQLISLWKGGE